MQCASKKPLKFISHFEYLLQVFSFFFLFIYYYYFLAVLGLHFCARAFSSCGKQGPLFIVVCGPLTLAASLVAEHRLQMRRLSSCGSRTQLLCGMWDLLRPGLEPVSPALAGIFSTTVPPGKPYRYFLCGCHWVYIKHLRVIIIYFKLITTSITYKYATLLLLPPNILCY